jgi:hypothetical protein
MRKIVFVFQSIHALPLKETPGWMGYFAALPEANHFRSIGSKVEPR